MRIVFMGTPLFATSILKTLIKEKYEVVGVVSQPDKKVGRKQIITPTLVKQCAVENGIDMFQPKSIKEEYQQIMDWKPDLIVTCAYGQMIPEHILSFPLYGCLNVHASLLPKLRGGAPIHKAIINGENKTGVSIMRMVKKMDAGDYMLQSEVNIEEDDTMLSLHDKLMECGSLAIKEAIPLLVNKKAVFIKQNEEQATFAYNISKEEERIDANRGVQCVYNQIRGLISWPVGYIVVNDKHIKIHRALKGKNECDHEVGSLFVEEKKLYLQCKNGSVELKQIQLEGRSISNAREFIIGIGRNFIK